MAKAEEVNGPADADDTPLFYFRPEVAPGDAWAEAKRANLPLRNNAGTVVDHKQWDA